MNSPPAISTRRVFYASRAGHGKIDCSRPANPERNQRIAFAFASVSLRSRRRLRQNLNPVQGHPLSTRQEIWPHQLRAWANRWFSRNGPVYFTYEAHDRLVILNAVFLGCYQVVTVP